MVQNHNRGDVISVLAFSLPVIISQACDSLMMFTDRYLLSQLDPVSPTASMSGGMTAFLLWIFGAGLLGFSAALVSQYRGAGDLKSALSVVPQGLILSFFLSLPLLIWGKSLGAMYFSFLKMPALEYPLAVQYLDIILDACPFVFAKVVFSSFFSGMGKTKVVMIVNMIGLIVNIPLSYSLIHGALGAEWQGVSGAALGTLFAEIIMTLIYIGIFLYNKREGLSWKFASPIFKKLVQYGAPTGLEYFVLTFAFNTFLTMFHSFGIHAAEAITIAMNWSWLTVLPFFGLNIGIMSMCGHALGAGNIHLVETITRSGLKIAFAIVGIASLAFLMFADDLVLLFGVSRDLKSFALASFMIRTLPIYCIFDATSFVLTGPLRASGDTKFCLGVSSVGHWGGLILCFLGTFYANFSPLMVWSIFIVTLGLQTLAFTWRYQEGHWKQIQMLSPPI